MLWFWVFGVIAALSGLIGGYGVDTIATRFLVTELLGLVAAWVLDASLACSHGFIVGLIFAIVGTIGILGGCKGLAFAGYLILGWICTSM